MDLLAHFASNLSIGVHEAVSISNLWYCFLGVFFGCLVGVLPGLGALVAISLLLPLTYHMPTSGALIMLAGVYFGVDYGGGTCSILLGVPGTSGSAVNVLDGFPMTKQGRGGIALFIKCIASLWGSAVGILLLTFLAPALANLALDFGAAEYFSLILLGLIAVSTVGQGSPIKGVAMMVVGLLCGVVGTDMYTGGERFTFGQPELLDGLGFISVAMGLFAVTEVIKAAGGETHRAKQQSFRLRDQLPTREDWKRSWMPMLRGSALGAAFGALPGTSSGMTTFLAYAVEKRVSKHPEQFGKGAIEGIASPEACNNAGVGTAFIPTLTLGIPGDAIMALMLGAMIMQGIVPGPQLITNNPSLFWGLIVSFWIGNIFLVILNIPLIGMWVRLLAIPYHLMYPAIILFTCIGVYSTDNSTFDLYILLAFGLIGYFMLQLRFEVVPLLLGMILGPMLEDQFRRAMLISDGDFAVFLQRPISATVMVFTVALILWSLWAYFRNRAKRSEMAQAIEHEAST